jgi:hypothetical protein
VACNYKHAVQNKVCVDFCLVLLPRSLAMNEEEKILYDKLVAEQDAELAKDDRKKWRSKKIKELTIKQNAAAVSTTFRLTSIILAVMIAISIIFADRVNDPFMSLLTLVTIAWLIMGMVVCGCCT